MKSNTIAESTKTLSNVNSPFRQLARDIVKRRFADIREGAILVRDQRGEWFAGEGNQIDATITVHDLGFYQQILRSGTKGAAAANLKPVWQSSLTWLPDCVINCAAIHAKAVNRTFMRIMTSEMTCSNCFSIQP
jgi:hypothetical protein